MKSKFKIVLTTALVLFVSVVYSQNLIPNGSFETYTSCPNSLDQMNRAQGWSSYRASPDYYNTCSAISGISPPNSTFGYQQPQSGNAYAGIITYANTGVDPNYREMLGTKLTTTLNIGTKYYFSFYVNLAGGYNYTLATDKIGLRFSKVSFSFSNPAPINNLAHYYSNNKVTDTLNWTKLQGSFVADSAYQYITFGNFFDDSNTDTLGIGPPPVNQFGYYYIDNVCLSTDSTLAFETFIPQTDNNQSILLYPNPCNDLLHITHSPFPKEIEVFDLVGQLMLRADNLQKNIDFILDISSLNKGIYLLKINTENKIIKKRIIISK